MYTVLACNISVYKKHQLYNRLCRNHIGSVVFQQSANLIDV